MDRDEELPISVRLAMCSTGKERDSSGCRASGRHIGPNSREQPVHMVLILPLPVPPLLRLQALVGVQRKPHRHLYLLNCPRKFRLRPLWWLRKSSKKVWMGGGGVGGVGGVSSIQVYYGFLEFV